MSDSEGILQMPLTPIGKALEDSQALVHSLLPNPWERNLRSAKSKSLGVGVLTYTCDSHLQEA